MAEDVKVKKHHANALSMKMRIVLLAVCPLIVIAICSVIVALYAQTVVEDVIYEAEPEYVLTLAQDTKEAVGQLNDCIDEVNTSDEVQVAVNGNLNVDTGKEIGGTLTGAQAKLFADAAGRLQDSINASLDNAELTAYGTIAEVLPTIDFPEKDFAEPEIKINDGKTRYCYTVNIAEDSLNDSDVLTAYGIEKDRENVLSVLARFSDICTADDIQLTATKLQIYAEIDPFTTRLQKIKYSAVYDVSMRLQWAGDLSELGTQTVTCTVNAGTEYTVRWAGIYISQDEIVLSKNGYDALKLTRNHTEGEDYTLTFTSSDENVAVVAENGQVDAVALSDKPVTVTAVMEYRGKTYTDTCTVYVINETDGITMHTRTMDLSVGQTGTASATVTPKDATICDIVWMSEDESIATVDENGTVTAVAPGKTRIIAVSIIGDYMAACHLTVTE